MNTSLKFKKMRKLTQKFQIFVMNIVFMKLLCQLRQKYCVLYKYVILYYTEREELKTMTMTFTIDRWVMAEEIGYTPKTTFWEDFSIADRFGASAVRDTYKRAFDEWKDDYVYLTELVMVLNHKIWQWYTRNEKLARVYNDLWEKADAYACDNLKGEELRYFLRTTD